MEDSTNNRSQSVKVISVIVPDNPFVRSNLGEVKHCLAALDVTDLMEWWPGKPHSPHRNPDKVQAIQRSLDWKRVAQIAAYLLQKEIVDAPKELKEIFVQVYGSKAAEPGRQWPPQVPRVVGFEKSTYPTFSNVLLHVNGASVKELKDGAAQLKFDADNAKLNFSVIDGQHRINGAYFAVMLRRKEDPSARWEIPAEIFLDLDAANEPPRRQAQIFIDVNFYQKKVDRSLVADLFPLAREPGGSLNDKERAQDLGRKLMLEVGPLVGMIQIPGIRYGVADVITLATLNAAIEDILTDLARVKITSLEGQSRFLAQCLDAWLEASGRKVGLEDSAVPPTTVVYQGRVLVSFLTLIPACVWTIRKTGRDFVSEVAHKKLVAWLSSVADRAGLLKEGKFLEKSDFKEKGFLGSGGLARFRDTLWAAVDAPPQRIDGMGDSKISQLADENRSRIQRELAGNG